MDAAIVDSRDFDYDYFGIKTLERSYLQKSEDGIFFERPQYMLMRVAVCLHEEDLISVLETYRYMSRKYFVHASPTMFNACLPRQQLASCFLVQLAEDSIDGIFKTMGDCAKIIKYCGGIGLHIHNMRARGSLIRGSNSESNGIIPAIQIYNSMTKYLNQGGNKRKGAIAIYCEPWHADIFPFLDLRKNTGAEEYRARDLFYGLWIPDLFMRRVRDDGEWSLMCPNQSPDLAEVHGEAFDNLYIGYERQGKYVKRVKARSLWIAILQSQIETGMPYMLYKDQCNKMSNQQNLGTIKSSNLCTEIIEYTSSRETATCNLASIALGQCVEGDEFCFDLLKQISKILTRNLNKVIDRTYYPVEEAKISALHTRPIGIGVQGLADVFMKLGIVYNSDRAKLLNRQIFETIYYGALEASAELAEKEGFYDSYTYSPMDQGLLQFDMWDVVPTDLHDWDALRKKIGMWGVRNSLLVALMPTATTAQILGNSESFEPYTSNIYYRRAMAGEFKVITPHLVDHLTKLGLWGEDIVDEIIAANGSIQHIERIPQDVRDIYKTVWEIPIKDLIDMSADRSPFIDQSQSFNIHLPEPDMQKLTSIHMYGWQKGLKTGMYYLHTRPASMAVKFTVKNKTVCKLESGDCCSA